MKRFTKEELLVPRERPVELEENSNTYPDIISVVPLEPVCTLSLDIGEVKEYKSIHKRNLLILSCFSLAAETLAYRKRWLLERFYCKEQISWIWRCL